jgi:predicted Zn-dependent protease
MKRLARALVILLVVLSIPAFAYSQSASDRSKAQASSDQERDRDKADKDRKKAAEREERNAREDEKILDEAQDEIDALALERLALKYDDPFLQEYVNELGQSLVPSETPAGVLLSFRVIRDREPNAMALPDGRIFVTTGLLTFVNSEAELAFVLGHEIGHVIENHYARSVREGRTRAKVGALVGAGMGALIGGLSKSKERVAEGAALGAVTGLAIAKITMNSYSRQQEDEADRRGIMLALDRRFDVAETDGLFQRLAKTFGEQDKFTNAMWGRHSRNLERIENIKRLLAGDVASRYNSLRSAGELTLGGSQMHLFTSAMIRDTAIEYMESDDRYDLAKSLFEQIVSFRARDPKTLWALGKVYKTVGRSAADKNKALDLLQQAVRLDERNRYPFIRRDYGLMQARLGNTSGAVESLKQYVLNHMDLAETQLTTTQPPDIEKMYDYLLTFGDSRWTAPKPDTRIVRAAVPDAPPSPTVVTTVPNAGANNKAPQNTLKPSQPARPPQKPRD